MTGLKNRVINTSSLNFKTRLKAVATQLLDQNQNVETKKIMLTPEMLVIQFSDPNYTKELVDKLKKLGFESVEVMNEMLFKISSIPEVVKFFVEQCGFNFGEFSTYFAKKHIDSNMWWKHIEKAKVDYHKLYMPKIEKIDTVQNILCLFCSGLESYPKPEATIYIENVMLYLHSLWKGVHVLTRGEKKDGTLFVAIEKDSAFSDKEIASLLTELNVLDMLDPKKTVEEILSDYHMEKFNQLKLSSPQMS